MKELNLASLLSPIERNAFFAETWEKKPLKIDRRDSGYFANLLAMEDLDRLIYYSRPDHFLDPPKNLRLGVGRTNGHALPLPEIWRAYAQGKTVAVHGVEQRWPAVTELCRSLEQELSQRVNANMYLTPKGSQGFDAHYDHQDVFIAQLDGRKHWRLYGFHAELPSEHGAHVPREKLGPPEELTLEAGDILYLPRGYVHEAYTTDQRSAHLTVGVFITHWSDLLGQALWLMSQEDVRFRRALPLGFLREGGTDRMRDQFRELLRSFAEEASLEEALDRLGDRFVAQLQAVPAGQFGAVEKADDVTLDTRLERNHGLISAIVEEKDKVSLRFPSNRIEEPSFLAPAMRYCATRTAFSARDLPGDLSEDARLALVRRLVREGFLRVSDA